MSRDGARPAGALRAARTLVLVLLALMLGNFVLWHALRFSAPTALIASTLAVAPWLFALPGVWRAQPNACLGALLLTTPYLGYGLMEVIANPGARMFAAATVFGAFALAVAAVALLRLSRRRAAAPT